MSAPVRSGAWRAGKNTRSGAEIVLNVDRNDAGQNLMQEKRTWPWPGQPFAPETGPWNGLK